jgi:hypothetical protein
MGKSEAYSGQDEGLVGRATIKGHRRQRNEKPWTVGSICAVVNKSLTVPVMPQLTYQTRLCKRTTQQIHGCSVNHTGSIDGLFFFGRVQTHVLGQTSMNLKTVLP